MTDVTIQLIPSPYPLPKGGRPAARYYPIKTMSVSIHKSALDEIYGNPRLPPKHGLSKSALRELRLREGVVRNLLRTAAEALNEEITRMIADILEMPEPPESVEVRLEGSIYRPITVSTINDLLRDPDE